MCNVSCVIFGATSLKREDVESKRVIEVGSLNVNGGLRSIIENWSPAEYIGVDIQSGPGVDVVCSAEDLVNMFGEESFDVVVSTEVLEHVSDWRVVVTNLKKICKKGGVLLITTRSRGFPFHAYPNDFWRYELNDMKNIFADFAIDVLESDREAPGVFLKAIKPLDFAAISLKNIGLYFVPLNRTTAQEYSDIKYKYGLTFFKLRVKESLKSLARFAYKIFF